MTAACRTRPVFGDAVRASSLAQFGLALVEGFRAYRTFHELSALSDAELAARGLARETLPQHAVHAAA